MTEEERRARFERYRKENLKRIPLDVKKSMYEEIKAHAEFAGVPVNRYIKEALEERMATEDAKRKKQKTQPKQRKSIEEYLPDIKDPNPFGPDMEKYAEADRMRRRRKNMVDEQALLNRAVPQENWVRIVFDDPLGRGKRVALVSEEDARKYYEALEGKNQQV